MNVRPARERDERRESVARERRSAVEVKVDAGAEDVLFHLAGAHRGAAGERGVEPAELDAAVLELDAEIGREQPLHAGTDEPAAARAGSAARADAADDGGGGIERDTGEGAAAGGIDEQLVLIDRDPELRADGHAPVDRRGQ